MNHIVESLKSWRKEQADTEGVAVYRVLINQQIEDIVAAMPRTKDEFLKIKGVTERKYEKYGDAILRIIAEEFGVPEQSEETGEKIFSVGQYLDLINIGLRTSVAKIKGEVSSCDFRGNYLFFSLKDAKDNSMINCFMWQSDYRMSGISIKEGMEIIVHGFPEIYKRSGRLSFHGDAVELVGEGALKKAYDELKQKLEREGLFALERKRMIPDYPQHIGLITSKTGAVIHDFLNNIGRFGFKISLMDSRVEGSLAVADLIAAVRSFKHKDVDVLVMIRGGGSLESLLAFNNEMLVREIRAFSQPVICGIGHDKDVPLAALACDMAVSTPTAVTRVLNASWERGRATVDNAERDIMAAYGEALGDKRHLLAELSHELERSVGAVFERFRQMEQALARQYIRMDYALADARRRITEWPLVVSKYIGTSVIAMGERLAVAEKTLNANNPERQLKLGYSIGRVRGKIVRSIRDVKDGDCLDLTVSDGMINSEVQTTASQ